MKILCIAECCCDLIFGGLPRLPEQGEEIYGSEFTVRPGGGANTPLNLARAGAQVTLLTALGQDDMGRRLRRELTQSGVRLAGRLEQPGTRTAVSAVLSTDSDRAFASYAGTGGAFFTPEVLEREIAGADLVHTYLGYCLAYPIAELCEKNGKLLSLDASYTDAPCSQEEREMLRRCHYLKVNGQEAARLAGDDDPERALRSLAEQVKSAAVVTLGGDGSLGMAGRLAEGGTRTVFRQPAIRAGEFRDACGAGDAFAAGFLLGVSQGKSLADSMRSGAALAGKCVTWLGGTGKA